ncbi:MAG: class I SAM-dependent methyltransferase [Saprospiraceae bacterium]|nr:class I SAM-dependent methyltransferase [Saprospiraceae bacterium]
MNDNKKEIGSEFDGWVDGYSDLMARIVPYYRTLMTDLFSLLPKDMKMEHLVELGCGNGNVLAYAASLFPSARLTGVDASSEMLEALQKRFKYGRVEGLEGLMQEVSFPAGQIDVVLASFSLHHLGRDDKKLVIQQAQQWLRPGGYFLYSDLMVEEGSEEHEALLDRWRTFVLKGGTQEDWSWLIDHHRTYDRVESETSLVNMFLQTGYNGVQTIRHEREWVALAAQA